MTAPGVGVEEYEFVEVRFKGGRKEFYRNVQHLRLTTGDAVVLEPLGGGWHVGHVSLKGELVRLQMRKKKVEAGPEIKPIQRLATETEIEQLGKARAREADTLLRGRVISNQLRLQMKLADVEIQADHSRAVFYYSADDRVDFRDLVRRLGDDLHTRVEMRQISLRQEAGRIGGIGSCGRELCCSTWLTDFKTVSTTAARYQQLSLNPAKLAGQCGRLKCCLNYELDTYLDAIKDIPSVNRPLVTAHGEAFLQKTDIFRRLMWFGYKGENEWHRLPTARVREIQELNRRGEQPDTLLAAPEPSAVPEPEVAQVEGLLERLDAFLGHPRVDPHGDPIPSADGQLRPVALAPQLLADVAPGTASRSVVSLLDTSARFLQHLDRLGLRPGTALTLLERFEYDGTLRVQVANGPELTVSRETALKVLVQ